MGTCPSCGCATEPVQITTKLVVGQKELAEAVNTWNARQSPGLAQASADQVKQLNDRWSRYQAEHQALVRQVAATYKPRHRWSWWRFTLTVR